VNIAILLNRVAGRDYPITASLEEASDINYFAEEDVAILNSVSNQNRDFLSRAHRLIISQNLIPESQRSLISEINRRSEEAFNNGWTKDRVEIRPFSYIQNVRSSSAEDVVVLLEDSELGLYTGSEERLVFKKDGDSPVLLNGLVAAGRALLYKDFERLIKILRRLSADREIEFPAAAALERCLVEDRAAFARYLAIRLPGINILGSDLPVLNELIRKAMRYA
jgi:hypothetical protein